MIYKSVETKDGKILINDTVVVEITDDGELIVEYDTQYLTENEAKDIAEELKYIITSFVGSMDEK